MGRWLNLGPGIAAIIQALPDEELKLNPLEQLLSFVDADIEHSLELAALEPPNGHVAPVAINQPGTKDATEFGLMALKCLEGIARGIQIPDDKPVWLPHGWILFRHSRPLSKDT
jgi:hypothetical protein